MTSTHYVVVNIDDRVQDAVLMTDMVKAWQGLGIREKTQERGYWLQMLEEYGVALMSIHTPDEARPLLRANLAITTLVLEATARFEGVVELRIENIETWKATVDEIRRGFLLHTFTVNGNVAGILREVRATFCRDGVYPDTIEAWLDFIRQKTEGPGAVLNVARSDRRASITKDAHREAALKRLDSFIAGKG